MKTVGIIGGLGPETTAEFYLALVSIFQEKTEAIMITLHLKKKIRGIDR